MNARLRVLSIMTGNQSQMHRSLFRHNRLALLGIAALVLAALTGSAAAEAPSVTAVLTSSEAAIGQAVQLQIQVKGDRNVAAPSEIAVDGLEIRSAGQMQSFEMRNFNMTSSVTFTYTIVPQRTGRFIIPPQTLRVGGPFTANSRADPKRYRFPGPRSGGSNRADDTGNPEKEHFR